MWDANNAYTRAQLLSQRGSRRSTATCPAATSPLLNAKSTTSRRMAIVPEGLAAAEPAPVMGDLLSGDTTERKNTATKCGAPPTATGTPNAPTAPKYTDPRWRTINGAKSAIGRTPSDRGPRSPCATPSGSRSCRSRHEPTPAPEPSAWAPCRGRDVGSEQL